MPSQEVSEKIGSFSDIDPVNDREPADTEDFVQAGSLSLATLEQMERLTRAEKEGWEAGDCHLRWDGIKSQEAFGFWKEGLMFITAPENVGKTSFILQRALSLLRLNPDLDVLDLSADDSFSERANRYVSILCGLDTPFVGFPSICTPGEASLRQKGFEKLMGYLARERLEIRSQSEDDICRPSALTSLITKFCDARPGRKVLVIIDAWNDILLPDAKSDEPEKLLLQELDKALKSRKALAMLTAHRRKSPGSEFSRKASTDDLKGSAYIKHYAKIICTLHNEVKSQQAQAEVYWNLASNPTEKLPVIEVQVQKNKTSKFKNWVFYAFEEGSGRSEECNSQESKMYMDTVYESLSRRRKGWREE